MSEQSYPEPDSVPSRDPNEQQFSDKDQNDIPAVAGGDDDTQPAQGEGEGDAF